MGQALQHRHALVALFAATASMFMSFTSCSRDAKVVRGSWRGGDGSQPGEDTPGSSDGSRKPQPLPTSRPEPSGAAVVELPETPALVPVRVVEVHGFACVEQGTLGKQQPLTAPFLAHIALMGQRDSAGTVIVYPATYLPEWSGQTQKPEACGADRLALFARDPSAS